MNYLYQSPDNVLMYGFDSVWFLNRSYTLSNSYNNLINFNKLNNISESELFDSIINDPKQLIYSFDSDNYLTYNKFPYSIPVGAEHFIYWTKNDKHYELILNDLENISWINSSYDYMFWCNPPKLRSVHTIKHYHLIRRPKYVPQQLSKIIKSDKITESDIITKPNRLEKLIIISRHGPREPITDIISEKFNQPVQPVQPASSLVLLDQHIQSNRIIDAKLTSYGANYCIRTGQTIKSLFESYIDFDQIYKTNKYKIFSSRTDRTIESAKYFCLGLFDQLFSASDIEITDSLFGDIRLTETEAELYRYTHQNMKLDAETKEIDNIVHKLNGSEVKSPKDYFNIYSTINTYIHHRNKLPDYLTNEMISELHVLSTDYYYELFREPYWRNLFTKDLLKQIQSLLVSDIKFAYLSTHDVVIYPLVLNMMNKISQQKLPEFCSSVRIELWSSDIRIYYDDLLINHQIF